MNQLHLPPKAPTEEIIISLGFAARLKTGETITEATTTVEVIEGADSAPESILSGSADLSSAPVVAQKIIGGVLGVTYLIKILATTSASRKIMGARALKITQGGAP